MVDFRESNLGHELALLVDVSTAGNSVRACQIVDEFVGRLSEHPVGVTVDLNAGDLLLTKGVMTRLKQQIIQAGATFGTVYSSMPQTQMAALDEGLYVKEKLVTDWTPIRQSLPIKGKSTATPPTPSATGTINKPATLPPVPKAAGVDLPDFSRPKTNGETKSMPFFDFIPVAPQSTDIPELTEPAALEQAPPADVDETVSLSIESLSDESDSLEVEFPDTAFETLYIRQTLRSGQTIRFNGNVVIVGDVHAGSEVTAGGDILVWGELRGIAHAGAQGNYKSEIRAMKIEALQLRISDYIARRPDRIYYHKDGAETVISPEVARVADGEIKIFKTSLPKI